MSDKKKTEATASTKGQNIKQAAPVPVLHPFNEMEHWFENTFPINWRRHFHGGWPTFGDFPSVFEGRMPTVDVINQDSEIQVRAEIPGVDKKDLDISVTEDSVSIKGSSKHEEKEEKGEYYRREISSG